MQDAVAAFEATTHAEPRILDRGLGDAVLAVARSAQDRARALPTLRCMSEPKRDWTDARAKVDDAGRCRVCGLDTMQLAMLGRSLEAAHTIGRTHDEPHPDCPSAVLWVNPDHVVELCGPATSTDTCHAAYDGHTLDLLPMLTLEEQVAAVRCAGTIAAAVKRLTGGKTIDRLLAEPPPAPARRDEPLIPF